MIRRTINRLKGGVVKAAIALLIIVLNIVAVGSTIAAPRPESLRVQKISYLRYRHACRASRHYHNHYHRQHPRIRAYHW